MAGLQSRLAKLKANWKNAQQRDPGSFGEFPLEDGRYIAKISLMEVNESVSSGRLQVHTEYEVVEGSDTGTTCHSYEGLESEDNLFYLQRKLAKLGVEEAGDITGLEALCDRISKEQPVVRIRVKTKDDFHNVYIDRLISGGEGSDGGEEAAPETPPPAETATRGRKGKGTPAPAPPPEPPAEAEAEVDLEVGDKVTVKTAKGNVIVVVTELINDESFKAKTPEGKIKLFEGSDLVI